MERIMCKVDGWMKSFVISDELSGCNKFSVDFPPSHVQVEIGVLLVQPSTCIYTTACYFRGKRYNGMRLFVAD